MHGGVGRIPFHFPLLPLRAEVQVLCARDSQADKEIVGSSMQDKDEERHGVELSSKMSSVEFDWTLFSVDDDLGTDVPPCTDEDKG